MFELATWTMSIVW